MSGDFHIQWHITDRCNLRCQHCYQDKFDGSSEPDREGLQKICDNLIDTMSRWQKSLTISLTGGEPLLKPEMWKIIDRLSRSDHTAEINIITNATLIERYIHRFKKAPKLKTIYVSLDGISPQVNDAVRGKGVFQKVCDNLRLLKENDLSVFIMFTLLKKNLKEAPQLIDFCRSRLLDGFILERFMPLGQGRKVRDELLSVSELEELYKAIFRQCNIEYSCDSARFHALKVDTKDELRLYGAECVVGKFGCAVLADGSILPCRRFALPIGNLLTTPLNDIWQDSQVLKAVRKRENLQGKCRDCQIESCLGCRALSYALSGDFLGSDPLCWLEPASKP